MSEMKNWWFPINDWVSRLLQIIIYCKQRRASVQDVFTMLEIFKIVVISRVITSIYCNIGRLCEICTETVKLCHVISSHCHPTSAEETSFKRSPLWFLCSSCGGGCVGCSALCTRHMLTQRETEETERYIICWSHQESAKNNPGLYISYQNLKSNKNIILIQETIKAWKLS